MNRDDNSPTTMQSEAMRRSRAIKQQPGDPRRSREPGTGSRMKSGSQTGRTACAPDISK
jgi:hypothetical protein